MSIMQTILRQRWFYYLTPHRGRSVQVQRYRSDLGVGVGQSVHPQVVVHVRDSGSGYRGGAIELEGVLGVHDPIQRLLELALDQADVATVPGVVVDLGPHAGVPA